MKTDHLLYFLLLSLCCGFLAGPVHSQTVPVSSPYFKQTYYTNPDGGTLSYQIMIPEGLRVDRKYPLVLVLHGRGGKSVAADILAKDSMRAEFPCFVIAPVSGTKAVWANPKSWTSPSAKWLDKLERLPDVIALIEGMIQSSPIDPDRIYVTGQSMGGIGTLGIIQQRPDLFAAAVPLCGGWDPNTAATFKDVPLWIFHGAKDRVIRPERSQVMVEALKAAGSEVVKYTEHPEAGHNIIRLSYGEPALWEWMFKQKKTPVKKDVLPDDATAQAEMMEKWMQFMTPGPEHQVLMKRVGKWNIDLQSWMDPDSPPQKNVLKCEYKPVLGNRYLSQQIMPMDFNGMPFEAHGFIGFDTIKNIYVSSWIDTFGTGIATGTGTRTENVINWKWIQTDPATGTSFATRAVEELISDDEFKFTIYLTLPDGREFINMTQHARRSPENE